MTERQAKSEIADIRNQLNSLIRSMLDVADRVDSDFTGVGNEHCARAIRRVAGNYESVLRVLNSINVADAIANCGDGRHG